MSKFWKRRLKRGFMYDFLVMAHSGWRWVALVALVFTTIRVLVGWLGKQNFTDLDANIIRVTRIIVAIQIGLGIIVYISALFSLGWPYVGAFTGGHVVPALLGYAGVEFAAARSKKVQGSSNKFKFASIGFVIAIILIYGALARVGGPFA
jgi:hypothetical protein